MTRTIGRKPKCLILTPFDAVGSRIYNASIRALENLHIEVIRIDHVTFGSNIRTAVLRAIDVADLIIADITRQNPNVMYEVGYAHALRKRTVLLISQETSRLPTDLLGHIYLTYDPSNLRSLSEQIVREADRFIKQSGSVQ